MQYDAINKVSQVIIESGLAEAVFLKGSIARSEDDQFSDVDMYVVVSDENENEFLKNRIKYMESYMPLIFWSESNFVGPQIVGVYGNALHFDLYTVKVGKIPHTDEIKIVYDKSGMLNSYEREPLSMSSSEIVTLINSFTFSLLEFEAAYSRQDLIWAARLASHLTGNLAVVLRYVYDRENSKLGMKRLYKYLPEEYKTEFLDVLESLTPSALEAGIRKLIIFTDKILAILPFDIKNQINISFYEMMKSRLTKK